MHFISDDTTGFLGKISFFSDNFGKSVVLTLYCQLPFLQCGRFPGKRNWTEAQQVRCVRSFLKTESITFNHRAFRLRLNIPWNPSHLYIQEHGKNSQDPAAPQSNSSCLEIDHFGETATGSIKLRQHFYQNY